MSEPNIVNAVGKRKTAIARVYIRKGTGKIIVNKKDIEEYFSLKDHILKAKEPIFIVENFSLKDHDIIINAKGGGLSGQVGAINHGISRALLEIDQNNRAKLKPKGLLTRDSRIVERKKYGQKGARKKFQFSKR